LARAVFDWDADNFFSSCFSKVNEVKKIRLLGSIPALESLRLGIEIEKKSEGKASQMLPQVRWF